MRASDFLGSERPNSEAVKKPTNHRICILVFTISDTATGKMNARLNSTWQRVSHELHLATLQVHFYFLCRWSARKTNCNITQSERHRAQRNRHRGIRMAAFHSRIYILCSRLTFLLLFFSGTNEQTTGERKKKTVDFLFIFFFFFNLDQL